MCQLPNNVQTAGEDILLVTNGYQITGTYQLLSDFEIEHPGGHYLGSAVTILVW